MAGMMVSIACGKLGKLRPLICNLMAFGLVEIMAGQAKAVVDLLRQQGSYDRITVHCDLAGIERFVLARRKALGV